MRPVSSSALLMDHEGRFAVRAAIEGPLGPAAVDAEVEATYDLRPPPIMLAVYVIRSCSSASCG